MNTTQPIRDLHALQTFKNYYRDTECNFRNYTLIIMGLNTALRINDILHIKWGDVYDFDTLKLLDHIEIKEKKTGKPNRIVINQQLNRILSEFLIFSQTRNSLTKNSYLFRSRKGTNSPLSRCQAFRIIKKAAIFAGFPENVSCHSLRKTFGYHAWKQGVQPALLMNIYNHSSYQITKRYLGIEQDDKDTVFLNVNL